MALNFKVGDQLAHIEATGTHKAVLRGSAGQCAKQNATYDYDSDEVLIFNLITDPTESFPIKDATMQRKYGSVLSPLKTSIIESQLRESQCEKA